MVNAGISSRNAEFASKTYRPLVGLSVLLAGLFVFPSISLSQQVSKEQTDQMNALFDQGWALLGQMDKKPGVLDEAIACYNKALQIDPNSATAYWKLSEATYKKFQEAKNKDEKTKLVSQATAYAEKAVALDPKSCEAIYWLGSCHATQADMAGILSAAGLVKKAKQELGACIQLDPTNRFAVLARAVLAEIDISTPWPLKDVSAAEKLALEAVKMEPNLTMATLMLAKVYIEKGDKAKAKAELELCLATKDPKYPWDSNLYDWPEARDLLKGL